MLERLVPNVTLLPESLAHLPGKIEKEDDLSMLTRAVRASFKPPSSIEIKEKDGYTCIETNTKLRQILNDRYGLDSQQVIFTKLPWRQEEDEIHNGVFVDTEFGAFVLDPYAHRGYGFGEVMPVDLTRDTPVVIDPFFRDLGLPFERPIVFLEDEDTEAQQAHMEAIYKANNGKFNEALEQSAALREGRMRKIGSYLGEAAYYGFVWNLKLGNTEAAREYEKEFLDNLPQTERGLLEEYVFRYANGSPFAASAPIDTYGNRRVLKIIDYYQRYADEEVMMGSRIRRKLDEIDIPDLNTQNYVANIQRLWMPGINALPAPPGHVERMKRLNPIDISRLGRVTIDACLDSLPPEYVNYMRKIVGVSRKEIANDMPVLTYELVGSYWFSSYVRSNLYTPRFPSIDHSDLPRLDGLAIR